MSRTPEQVDRSPAPPQPEQDGKGYSWLLSLKAAISTAVIAALVIGALALVAWWLAAPRGELRLAVGDSIQNDQEKRAVAASLFEMADSQIDEAQRYHALASLQEPDATKPLLSVPPPQRPGGHPLQNLITNLVINVETVVDEGTGRIALSIDGIATLNALYEKVGWYDFFVAISSIERVECRDPAEVDCYQVRAQFSPSRLRPEVFEGTVEAIARDLAVLVLTGVALDHEVAWKRENKNTDQAEPYLFEASIPRSMAALELTALGMDILRKGAGHPICRALTGEACRAEGKRMLEEGLASEQDGLAGNPMAALGLSLLAIDEGLSAAQQLKADSIIEGKLREAERWMMQARQSAFIRESLADVDFAGQFQALGLQGGVLDSGFFDNMRNFVCALDAFRRADWEGCLQKVGEIKAYPDVLQPYLEAAAFYAQLRTAEDATARSRTWEEIEARLNALANETGLSQAQKRIRQWALQRVLVLDACLHIEELSQETFVQRARSLIDSAPDGEARRMAKIEVAGCRSDPSVVPDEEVAVLNRLAAEMDSDEARHRLEFALARYYVRTGNFDTALALLEKALALPYIGPYVRSAPDFAAFMESRGHSARFMEAFYSSPAWSTAQICDGREFF